MIREIVREIVGFTNYEKRMMEYIRIGTGHSAKKGLHYVKQRLGTMARAKAKREELEAIIQSMKHHEEHPKDEVKDDHKKEEATKAK